MSERDLAGYTDRYRDAIAALDESAIRTEISAREFATKRDELKDKKAEYDRAPSAESKSKLDIAVRQATEMKATVDRNLKELERDTISLAKRTSVSRKDVLSSLKIFHERRENERIENILKYSQSVDLCFVIDASGSMHMDDVFSALRRHIRSILGLLQTNYPHLEFELSLIAYRDPEDGAKHLTVLPLTTSRTKFETFLEDIKCSGGGDQCEDVLGGLKAAAELNWKLCNRLLFLCGDAPCHGREFHSGCHDWHPDGLPDQDSRNIIHQLVEKRIQMFFWKINSTTDIMIRKFNENASSSLSPFPTDRSRDEFIITTPIDITSAESIATAVRRSVHDSMTGSLTASASRTHSVKPKAITHTLKNLSTILEEDDISETKGDIFDSKADEVNIIEPLLAKGRII